MAMFLNTPLPYKRYKKISETTYFVDKSLILNDIFGCMEEETQYICITRPRRFGKTIMANMLGAFFGKAWDASQIFDHLKIADSPEYHQYLNQYDIIYIDFSRLPENCTSYRQYINRIITGLKNDLAEAYPEYQTDSIYALWDILSQISEQTDRQFVFIMKACRKRFQRGSGMSLEVRLRKRKKSFRKNPWIWLTRLVSPGKMRFRKKS